MRNPKMITQTITIALTVWLLAGCVNEGQKAPATSNATTTLTPTAAVGESAYSAHPTAASAGIVEKPKVGEAEQRGWTEYEVTEEGFAVSMPSEWVSFDANPENVEDMISQINEQIPPLAEHLEGRAATMLISGIKFWGFDLSEEALATGFSSNASIIKVRLKLKISLDTLGKAEVANLKKQYKDILASEVSQERVTLPAGQAVRLSYEAYLPVADDQQVKQALIQYILIQDGNEYVLNFVTPVDQADAYGPIFEKIAESFKFLED